MLVKKVFVFSGDLVLFSHYKNNTCLLKKN